MHTNLFFQLFVLLRKTEEHWFSFDDQRVRPTHKGDIERYYGGKECAYMLYYRQKSLLRPAEASGNPKHLVPQHILSEIEETNSTLRHQRYLYLRCV